MVLITQFDVVSMTNIQILLVPPPFSGDSKLGLHFSAHLELANETGPKFSAAI